MNRIELARALRHQQTKEEKQLWAALRAGRFAGFKFRRQHPLGPYVLDFYCALAELTIELDGFQHGLPENMKYDRKRAEWLSAAGIEVLRFWNGTWNSNRDGVLLSIWSALHRRVGRGELDRMCQNRRYVPPDPARLNDQSPLP